MTPKLALRLALLCISTQLQRLAVDANLYLHFNFHGGKKAFELREQLREARQILEEMERNL